MDRLLLQRRTSSALNAVQLWDLRLDPSVGSPFLVGAGDAGGYGPLPDFFGVAYRRHLTDAAHPRRAFVWFWMPSFGSSTQLGTPGLYAPYLNTEWVTRGLAIVGESASATAPVHVPLGIVNLQAPAAVLPLSPWPSLYELGTLAQVVAAAP